MTSSAWLLPSDLQGNLRPRYTVCPDAPAEKEKKEKEKEKNKMKKKKTKKKEKKEKKEKKKKKKKKKRKKKKKKKIKKVREGKSPALQWPQQRLKEGTHRLDLAVIINKIKKYCKMTQ